MAGIGAECERRTITTPSLLKDANTCGRRGKKGVGRQSLRGGSPHNLRSDEPKGSQLKHIRENPEMATGLPRHRSAYLESHVISKHVSKQLWVKSVTTSAPTRINIRLDLEKVSLL